MVDKAALEQIFPKCFGFVCQFSCHQTPNFSHVSSGASTMDHFQCSYRGTQSHPKFRIRKAFYGVRNFKKSSLARFEVPTMMNFMTKVVYDTLHRLLLCTNTNVSDSPAASIFSTGNGSNMFLRKVGTHLQGYTASEPGISQHQYSPFCRLHVSRLYALNSEFFVIRFLVRFSF
jgi:hypothetical protein